ncbi:hypothetical protein K3495_g4675 [Podosphaera aphanis]|nr:hypothetical protein K3495_g4675 [Podosphaera aphanis]
MHPGRRRDDAALAIPPHPQGIKPLGNQYLAATNARRCAGRLQSLPEEILALLLESLDAAVLVRLGATCTYLHAFATWDELWKALFVGLPNSSRVQFTWLGTWRRSYLKLHCDVEARLQYRHVFSDILYRPFMCLHTPLSQLTSNIPQASAIPRLENLSLEQFLETWCSRPFLLTQPVREWPAFASWNLQTLQAKYAQVQFRAEAVDWSLDDYVSYMRCNSDESPLYLFDKDFVNKMDLITGKNKPSTSYWTPECFEEDLFTVLGDQRPDFRWLIIGPERSGSTFHIDPNATSAWNAVLRGSKYWIMFPPTKPCSSPPGVFVSEDESEVTSPLSIAEWIVGFHAEARRTPGCIEGVCGEGELLHVPSGWWHLVVNLEPTIAITQNFVPRTHLPKVIDFLQNKPDQVSGFSKDIHDPCHVFLDQIRAKHPDLLHALLPRTGVAGSEGLPAESGSETPGFSFGFGDDSDQEVP